MDEATRAVQQMEVEGDNVDSEMGASIGQEPEKASDQHGGGLLGFAKRGLELLKEKLSGRTVWRSSEDGT